MDISVITVTYNSKPFIGRLCNSLKDAAHGVTYEHIVVDNGSSDGTVEYLKEKYPHVTVIANSSNTGFAHANNQGFAESSGVYMLFLNADMKLNPGSLKILYDWMEGHKYIGIAGPKLRNEFGQLNRYATPRRFPRMIDLVWEVLKVPHVYPKVHDHYLMRDESFEKEIAVDSLRGSFMMVRSDLLHKLGWAFDPRYFLWFDDVDLCKEAKQHGYDVVYTPIIAATDYVGQSFKLQPSVWKQRYYTESMVKYARKWLPSYKAAVVIAVRPIGIFLTWVYAKFAR